MSYNDLYKKRYLKYKYKYMLQIKLQRQSIGISQSKPFVGGAAIDSDNQYLDSLYNSVQESLDVKRDDDNADISGPNVFLTYGTVTNKCIDDMINHLSIGPDDIFYDFGSGIGNVCFKMAMTAGVKKSMGIEISGSRVTIANAILERLRKEREDIQNKEIGFIEGNFVDYESLGMLNDATVIFTDSIMYSQETLEILESIAANSPNLRYFVSMKSSFNNKILEHVERRDCRASWSMSQYNVYRPNK